MNAMITLAHPDFEAVYAARWMESEARDRKIRERRGFETRSTGDLADRMSPLEKTALIVKVMRANDGYAMSVLELVEALESSEWIDAHNERVRSRLEKGVKAGFFVYGPLLPNPAGGPALKSYRLAPTMIFGG